ncbi:MAG: enoyl-CoA hydratase [Rhodobacteraceae bacterium]|nr:MAG: enoyl-CoA hydratase [Paracoccaceae bacterium]|tara:strand:- start:155 stop:949 length:795 start_codon:yes stop_codon:yes gene_type:complete
MNETYETIELTQINPHIILITLNRPKSSNAFNTKMALEITDFFENIQINRRSSRVIIVTGSGQRAFSAGGDLKERQGMDVTAWKLQHLAFEKMIDSVISCQLPVIGAINGAAVGGGCELAAAFDFSYASETATFAQTETKIGIIPGIGGTQNLARAVGERRAKELIFSGKKFTAYQALEWGLINAIYSYNDLLPQSLQIASQISENAPLAVKMAKRAIHEGLQTTLSKGMELELECYYRTVPTQDRVEGVLAFNEKRNPIFKGK